MHIWVLTIHNEVVIIKMNTLIRMPHDTLNTTISLNDCDLVHSKCKSNSSNCSKSASNAKRKCTSQNANLN